MNRQFRRVAERIEDIRGALGNTRSDLVTLTKEQFLSDGKTQRAVIESIIVVGESANNIMRLDPGIEQRHPEAWRHLRDVCDMRLVLTLLHDKVSARFEAGRQRRTSVASA